MTARVQAGGPRGGRQGRQRRSGVAVALAATVLVAVLATGCASKHTSTTSTDSGRPDSPATVEILSPKNDSLTGSTIDLKLAVHDASVVAADPSAPIDPKKGYIHVSVDGRVIGMIYTLNQVVNDLSKGAHTIEAEFVATDHEPFANRPSAKVVIQVH
jgi:hypothetical protein